MNREIAPDYFCIIEICTVWNPAQVLLRALFQKRAPGLWRLITTLLQHDCVEVLEQFVACICFASECDQCGEFNREHTETQYFAVESRTIDDNSELRMLDNILDQGPNIS